MLKHLAKDSLVYVGANLLQKLIPLLVIPVITNYFGKDALKVYDVSFVYAYLFSWLIILGQDNATSILFLKIKKRKAARKY
jgi:O-antigen/teichoic acid export membrane protein